MTITEKITVSETSRAINALRQIVKALRVSSAGIERETGVTAAQLFVLRELAAEPRQSMAQLVERTLTTQSTISEVVGRLVDRRLVTRHVSPDDARRSVLSISARGRAILADAPRSMQTVLASAFSRLPSERRHDIADGLEAWLAEAGLTEMAASMFFEPDTASHSLAPRARRSSQ